MGKVKTPRKMKVFTHRNSFLLRSLEKEQPQVSVFDAYDSIKTVDLCFFPFLCIYNLRSLNLKGNLKHQLTTQHFVVKKTHHLFCYTQGKTAVSYPNRSSIPYLETSGAPEWLF